MQLKPEYEFAAFENVYSMSGMPEQHFGGYNNDDNDNPNNDDRDDFANHFDDMRYYLGPDEKTNSLKRGPEQDPLESSKRAKTEFGSFQQGPMGPFQEDITGMEGNLFNANLPTQSSDLHRAGLAQRHMDFGAMNSGSGLGRMEMRIEQETNRQQQSALMANEMALMGQQRGGTYQHHQGSFGGNMDGFSYNGNAVQRQPMADNNNSFHSHNSGGRNQMNDLQNFQGFPVFSSMGAQPFLSNMFDMQLLNNRMGQQHQGSFGGFNGGTLPPLPGTNFNQPVMPAASQMHQSGMGPQLSLSGFSSSGFSLNGNGSPAADAMPSLGPFEMMQLPRMNIPGAPSAASLQQQSHQRQIMPQQQPSSFSEMTYVQENPQRPQQQQQLNNQLLQLDMCQPTLPPLEEPNTPHYSQRTYVPFSIEEDANWLSEFQCFIRSEILELFRVSQQGIKVRNAQKSLTVNQVGIRCRFCAHLQHGTRANRASCFPSKIEKIYQSFTMMLREHFPSCTEIPETQKQRFMQLQNMNAQGASNAKGFWEHAARKKGLVDIRGEDGRGGIHIFENSLAQAAMIPPFGADSQFRESKAPTVLIHISDRPLVSNFLYALMEQVYRVHLAPSERKGNRKTLPLGTPGFGCRYCYEAGRMGLCRLFPARRRTIHTKIPDLYDHIKRCPLCPQQVKDRLIYLHGQDNGGLGPGTDQESASRGREREFFERIWSRLGHKEESE